MSSFKVAIAIPTFLREETLVNTLRQALDQKPRPSEILVIDQTPNHTEETLKILTDWSESGNIRWIIQAEPSLTRARNKAVMETDADIVAFLDDDVLITQNWLAAHARHYVCSDVSAVVGRVYHRINEYTEVDLCNPDKGTESTMNFSQVSRVDFLHGCNFSVRKEHFIRAGGFDQAFVGSANFEENDFAQRLIRSGGVILADPDAWLIHLRYPSGGCRISGNTFPEWTKSYNYFLYAFRYVRGWDNFVAAFKRAIQVGPLRQENRTEPKRLPGAFVSCIWGFSRALIQALRGPESPWT